MSVTSDTKIPSPESHIVWEIFFFPWSVLTWCDYQVEVNHTHSLVEVRTCTDLWNESFFTVSEMIHPFLPRECRNRAVLYQPWDVHNVWCGKQLETSETHPRLNYACIYLQQPMYSNWKFIAASRIKESLQCAPMQIFDEEHNVWFLDNGGAMLAVLHAVTPIRHLW